MFGFQLFAQYIKSGDTIYQAAVKAKIEIKIFNKPADFYVYILVDPCTDRPFYIGKGKGGRAREHLRLWRRGEGNSKKNAVISDIIVAGLEPLVFCLDEGMKEYDALVLEKRIMRIIGFTNLTNLLIPEDSIVRAKAEARAALRRMVRPEYVPLSGQKMYWSIIVEFAKVLSMKDASA